MNFEVCEKAREVARLLSAFMDENVYPNETAYLNELESGDRWRPLELIEDLKAKARAAGLWNLFLPAESGLTNLE